VDPAADILSTLRNPDERTLHFNPYGLGGRLRPEDAARFQAASIARATLVDDVPADVRDNFERAKRLHLYGVLEYDFFTVAADYALLVLEGALRIRFVSYYDCNIPVVRKGAAEALVVRTFDDVRAARRHYRLRSEDGTHPLPVGAGALLDWTRRERLLTGTRTRVVDRALAALRDHAAHPVTHTIQMPPQSASTLIDVAELINKLWDHATPGGRLFPAPVERRARVAALAPDGSAAAEMRLDQVSNVSADQRSWLYTVVLAVQDERLTDIGRDGLTFAHRPGFQTTVFPCEQLWSGSWEELRQEIDAGAFSEVADTVTHLDRLFFIRRQGDVLDDARSPRDLLALEDLPNGCWYAVIADSPLDAWAHVRDHEGAGTVEGETCPECFVRIKGRYENPGEALALARTSVTSPPPGL
jgi:hypothetical protein